jgi:uncharacterized integral membrane protein (TIGR00698 family)
LRECIRHYPAPPRPGTLYYGFRQIRDSGRIPLGDTTRYGYISDEALLSLDSMEGIHQLPRVAEPVRKPLVAPKQEVQSWRGYLLPAAVAVLAYGIHYLPIPPFRVISGSGTRYPVSAAIIAMVAGLLVRNLLSLPGAFVEGAKGLARRVIPATIVLAGAGLNLKRIVSVGPTALFITLMCIVVAIAVSIWSSRLFKVPRRTGLLIGAGTAICGTSAIVAVAPLIDAEDEDLMVSIGTVNILGLVLMFLLPAVGRALSFSDNAFGIWAGTSIHAVPQVVAAGFTFSTRAGELATLVKLVRVSLLAPFVFALGFLHARSRGSSVAIQYARLVPPFVYGFLALSLLNTMALLPVLKFGFGEIPFSDVLTNFGEGLLTLSMAAMGLEVNVRFLARTGGKAILTGTAAVVAVCLISLIFMHLLL